VIASVSGNAIYPLCFRIFALNRCVPFTLVRWCPSLSAAIVTQLVTHAVFFSGMLPGGLSLIPQPLSNLFLGGRHGAGQSGSLVTHAVTNPARHRAAGGALSTLWVPIIHPCWSGGMPVLVEDAAEPVPSADIEVRDPLGIGNRFG